MRRGPSFFTRSGISPPSALALAKRFDQAVVKAERLAAEFAETGLPYTHGTRRVLLGKFKFSLVYLTRPDEVVVIAVAPFKRKPGYWRPRIGAA